MLRAVRRADPAATTRAHEALSRVVIVELTHDILLNAGLLDPPELRTLDAIHLSAAKGLGDDLAAVVTYDDRMAAAAVRLGLPVKVPT